VSDAYLAGLLHDIGMVHLPEAVLLKAGPLTDEERARVQASVLAADHILARSPRLARVRLAVGHHRERYDGQGYPDRLGGEDIPLMARILAVAESCDAMMSPRPYRPPLEIRTVEAILAEDAGKQWDPDVVEHFLACRNDLFPLCTPRAGSSVGPVAERSAEDWGVDSTPQPPQRQRQTVTAACQDTVPIRKQ
jgi:HD-GYP domain-containing protein (c-di-GMP phosphodiesterase class II)